MDYILEIKEEAVLDIQEAFNFYENSKIGLGDKFLNALDGYFNQIQKSPKHYQIKRKPYREAYIRRFPYVIIYEIDIDKVIVYAVFNTWQNPKKKVR